MDWNEKIKSLEGWHFGGKGSGIEDELVALVVEGKKTATCSWYEAYAVEDVPLPKVGQQSYVMDSKDKAICVLEYTSIDIKKFLEVDEQFAFDEGEGDRSYEHWKMAHENFFSNYGEEIGLKWNSETQHVVCERFKVLHIF